MEGKKKRYIYIFETPDSLMLNVSLGGHLFWNHASSESGRRVPSVWGCSGDRVINRVINVSYGILMV